MTMHLHMMDVTVQYYQGLNSFPGAGQQFAAPVFTFCHRSFRMSGSIVALKEDLSVILAINLLSSGNHCFFFVGGGGGGGGRIVFD